MRILYLSPTAVLGGAERVLLSVMAAIQEGEPSASLRLLVPGPGPLAERAVEMGVEIEIHPLPSQLARLGDSGLREQKGLRGRCALLRRVLGAYPAVRKYGRGLAETVQATLPDLIHSNGIKTHLLAWFAGIRDVPIVWHAHDFYSDRPVVGRLLRWAHGSATRGIAVSEAVKRDLTGLFPRLPVCVVPNAVDLTRFSPRPGDSAWLDAAAGLPPAAGPVVRVGLVATYARWKGQEIFLHSAAHLLAASCAPTVRFYIIGGPLYQTAGSQFTREELQASAARLGLTGHVGFVDFQPNPCACYQALDVVVHASTRPEPFGLTIAEAMACGRAVVAVQAGGAAELFSPGRDAVGVPPGDAEALAAAVAELIHDPERRRQLGLQARHSAERRFDTARLPAQIRDVYANTLRRSADTSPDPILSCREER